MKQAIRVSVLALYAAGLQAQQKPFSLKDTAGKLHTQEEWHNQKAIVLFFVNTECPVASGYVPEMNRIEQAYAGRGVLTYGVQTDANSPAGYSFGFPVLRDPDHILVRMAGATVTPQAAVLTSDGGVRYLGRIDNRVVDFGKQRSQPTRRDLRDALDAVLTGQPVAEPVTKSIGCAIPQAHDSPTFNKDIAPILHRECASCHRPGQVAPFSLLTYQDASKRAALIAEVTRKRYMPPWKPEPGTAHFFDERRLSDEQIELIQQWAENGVPEGDPALRPTPPEFASGWRAGEPDAVFSMPKPFAVAADGQDVIQCFVIPLNFSEDHYVRTVEFHPGNARVVHHALFFLDTSGEARKLNDAPAGSGYSCFGGPRVPLAGSLGGWAPGATPQTASDGMAFTVGKNADLVLQVHYHPSGKPEIDQSSLGLTFTTRPTKALTHIAVGTQLVDLSPGDARHEVVDWLDLTQDVELANIAPHAHLLCKEMQVDARLPDGTIERLIRINDWDFNWQGEYRYAEPVKLPKGTRIELRYVYDNSAANLRNPSNPPKRVTYGEQTTDEMAFVFLLVAVPQGELRGFQKAFAMSVLDRFFDGGEPATIMPEQMKRLRAGIPYFDSNHNGRLEPEERKAFYRFLKLLP